MHQGTDASISTHIENIMKRNYVELIPGRKLKPSRLGLVLAQGYHLIDSSLVLPQVRSDIESECNKIAKGLADRDVVVHKAIESEYHLLALGSVIFDSQLKVVQLLSLPFRQISVFVQVSIFCREHQSHGLLVWKFICADKGCR